MMKIQVSQDFLYDYLKEHGFIITILSTYMGISESIVRGCFHHDLNRLGRPMSFSAANIAKLNEALTAIADDLRRCVLTFGSDQTFTNQRGVAYDPALVEQIKNGMGKFFKMKGMTERVLRWNKTKCDTTLAVRKSPMYGKVSREDADRLNAELLSVAGVLSSYEVVEQNPDKQEPETKINKGTPAPVRNEWDNTSLDLWERYAAFHRLFPDGLIAFSVNGGFTVCEEDACLLARIDTTLKPYTDPITGHVTLWMNENKWQQMRRAWDDGEEMVAVTPMYAE